MLSIGSYNLARKLKILQIFSRFNITASQQKKKDTPTNYQKSTIGKEAFQFRKSYFKNSGKSLEHQTCGQESFPKKYYLHTTTLSPLLTYLMLKIIPALFKVCFHFFGAFLIVDVFFLFDWL